jgi:hypothetical protein
MEFENFNSVKAKTRRNTPVVIRSSTGVHILDARVRQHDRSRL